MTGNFSQISQQGTPWCWDCGILGHTRRNCHMRSQDVSNHRRNVRCSSIRLTISRPKSTNSISRIEDRDQVSAGESTAALQQKDQEIGSILKLLLRQNSRLRAEEVISESNATKGLWRQWDSLLLKDGVIFRQSKQRLRPVLQLVVPASKRAEFIAECHRNTNGGHRAFRTTLDRVRRRGFWMGWRRDVERYGRQCRDCSSFV